MAKLKVNRSAAKRFKAIASGYKYRSGFRNHILTKKSSKRKSHLALGSIVCKADLNEVRSLMRVN